MKRLVATIVVTVVVAVVTAVILAILDLYLAGHGYASIRREWTGLGISMSPADLILLAAVVLASVTTSRAFGRRPS